MAVFPSLGVFALMLFRLNCHPLECVDAINRIPLAQ